MQDENYTLDWLLDYIANRIRLLREERHLSAQGLSLDLGQNKSFINKIENRRNTVSIESLYYICMHLGVTLEEFFDTGTKHPARQQELLAQTKSMDDGSMSLLIEMAQRLNNSSR